MQRARTLLLAAGILVSTVSPLRSEEGDTLEYRSDVAEYYRQYYERAMTEADAPGAIADGAARELVRFRARKRSREWADALLETLHLRSEGTFMFRARQISPVPEGASWLDTSPVGGWVSRSGTWTRSGDVLTLTVSVIDGHLLPSAFTWRGSFREEEIVLAQWRDDAGPAVLVRMPAPPANRDTVASVTRELGELRDEVAELLNRVTTLQAEVRRIAAGSVGEPAAAKDHWIEILRSERDDRWLQAAMKLRELDAREVAPDLERIVRGQRGGMARVISAEVLGHWRVLESVDSLIESLSDKDNLVRAAAGQALVRITRHVVPDGELEGEPAQLAQYWKQWWQKNERAVRASEQR